MKPERGGRKPRVVPGAGAEGIYHVVLRKGQPRILKKQYSATLLRKTVQCKGKGRDVGRTPPSNPSCIRPWRTSSRCIAVDSKPAYPAGASS